VSAIGSFIGGRERNTAQTEAAREQMAFQERMSSTAHQREVKDLRKAGLNPILSSRLGGASSPGGAQPNIENVIGEATKSGVSSALAARIQNAEIGNLEAQAEKAKADAALAYSHSVESGERTTSEQVRQDQMRAEMGHVGVKTDLDAARLPTEAKRALAELEHIRAQVKVATVDYIVKNYGVTAAQAAQLKSEADKQYFGSAAGRALRLFQLGSEAVLPAVSTGLGVIGVSKGITALTKNLKGKK
jgi:hypothetical protein